MSARVTLVMPAKAEYLILARLALAGIARQVPMNEDILADLKLAVTEACGNAVRHAYALDRAGVRVSFRMEPDHIEIEVADEGTGGDHPPPVETPPDDLPAESGMGLAIIRAIVDELEIDTPTSDSGTIVRMRKRLLPG